MMIMMLQGRHLTDEAAEIVMLFLNMALNHLDLEYRFPKKLSTFIARMDYQGRFYSGITQYVTCTDCHHIHALPSEQEERKKNRYCKRVTKYNSVGIAISWCNVDLYRVTKKEKLIPHRIYMYNSVIETIKKFLVRDGFAQEVTAWKNRRLQKEGHLFDIHDGNVWKSFKINPSDQTPFFFQSDFNLGFAINVDWYQQYAGSVYSVGAIYLTCLNLPRKIRNLRSNLIFVGLMPGPGEAHLQQINSYLQPLIDELKTLMGVGIEMATSVGSKVVRGALILGTLDLPAAAKTFGFSSHNSTCACRKCEREFPSLGGGSSQRNFAGGWNGEYANRTKESNLKYAIEWSRLTTEADRKDHVKKYGTRLSAFHQLSYFDPVRMVVFDPLHNVWLGTCKRIMHHVFIERKMLKKDDMEYMAGMINKLVLPSGYDCTSIARKILVGDGFGYFKADEWRVFTLFLGPLVLKGRLPAIDYNNWMVFVAAVQVMSMSHVSLVNAHACHLAITQFCKEFERLYKKECLYSNLHYHIHLLAQMLDYGSWHSHHAFHFERYNSDLKNINTNSRNLMERTIVHRFLEQIHKEDLFSGSPLDLGPNVDISQIKSLFLGRNVSSKHKTYMETVLNEEINDNNDDNYDLIGFIEYSGNLDVETGYAEAYGYEPLSPKTIRSLKMDVRGSIMAIAEYKCLVEYYQYNFDTDIPYMFGKNEECLVSNEWRKVVVSDRIHKFKSIDLLGQHYISSEAASTRSPYVRAYFKDPATDKSQHQMRPAEVKFFFRHEMDFLNETGDGFDKITFTFAYVEWFEKMDSSNQVTTFDTINSTCYKNSVLTPSFMNILPVHCIHSPVGAYIEKFENCNIFIDFPRKIEE
ncbi:unnamed protein product [Rhizopus stolonifer]